MKELSAWLGKREDLAAERGAILGWIWAEAVRRHGVQSAIAPSPIRQDIVAMIQAHPSPATTGRKRAIVEEREVGSAKRARIEQSEEEESSAFHDVSIGSQDLGSTGPVLMVEEKKSSPFFEVSIGSQGLRAEDEDEEEGPERARKATPAPEADITLMSGALNDDLSSFSLNNQQVYDSLVRGFESPTPESQLLRESQESELRERDLREQWIAALLALRSLEQDETGTMNWREGTQAIWALAGVMLRESGVMGEEE